MAATFEWNAEKAAQNYADHGVTFEEASSVFADAERRNYEESAR